MKFLNMVPKGADVWTFQKDQTWWYKKGKNWPKILQNVLLQRVSGFFPLQVSSYVTWVRKKRIRNWYLDQIDIFQTLLSEQRMDAGEEEKLSSRAPDSQLPCPANILFLHPKQLACVFFYILYLCINCVCLWLRKVSKSVDKMVFNCTSVLIFVHQYRNSLCLDTIL